MQKEVFACVDGSIYSRAVSDYGVAISNRLNLTLKLLNTIEHSHISKESNLSGNIGLGSRDELLETLSSEDEKESKELIAIGRKILESLKSRAIESKVSDIEIAQRHGSLYQNLIELQNQIRILILGLKGRDSEGKNLTIGQSVEDIIRSLKVPTLLVNREFKPIKRVLIAYNGSKESKKALELIAKEPIFSPNIERIVISIDKSLDRAKSIVDEARDYLSNFQTKADFRAIEGDAIEKLIEELEQNSIDLIAMGAFSHNRLRSAIFGSFTSKVLSRVDIPILLLR